MELHRRNFLGTLVPKLQPEELEATRDRCQDSQGGYLLEVSRKAMGCQFAVYFPARSEPSGMTAALQALDHVEFLEKVLSIYRMDSVISRINQSDPDVEIQIESEVCALLLQSLDLAEKTQGAFDITSGFLSELWGFHRKQGRIPAAIEIANALAGVGVTQLEIDPLRWIATRRHSKTKLDLGAIGKGYAVDQAAKIMREGGIEDFLLHGGTSTVWGNGSQTGTQTTPVEKES